MKPSRRKFVQQSLMAAGTLPLFDLKGLVKPFTSSNKADIVIFNTNWGFDGSLEAFCAKSKEAGYDGIEVWVPSEEKDQKELVKIAKDYGLKLGLLAGNWGKTHNENVTAFQNSIKKATSCEPVFINCHSGRDYFSFEQNQSFIDYALKASKESSIPIYHETHRGRILFCTNVAKQFLTAYEELRLTLDISHWTVVHESLLQDQEEIVQLALERTSHIHSRVGFQEAPQIPNPSSEHHAKSVSAHFKWWDKVVELHSTSGKTLTMTTEFGPPPYMWVSPETGQPLEKVWDMNVMMMKLWKERYA